MTDSLITGLTSLPDIASAALAATDAGTYPSITLPVGTTIRKEKTVYDIGAMIAYSFFQQMAKTNVLVPAALSIAFDAELGPISLGVMEMPGQTRIRAALVAEAARLKMTSSGIPQTAEFARIATAQGLTVENVTEAMTRILNRLETIITAGQSSSMLAALMDEDRIEGLEAFITMPEVSIDDINSAKAALTSLQSALVSNVDLTIAYADLLRNVTSISCYQNLRALVRVKMFYGLPVVPISVAALVDMIRHSGKAEPTTLAGIPQISRITEGDRAAEIPGQYKFWQLDAPSLFGQISIADVAHTVSRIDAELFGIRPIQVSLDALMTFALNSANGAFAPSLPLPGQNLVESPILSGLRAVTAMTNAMSTHPSPFLTAINNALSLYKLDSQALTVKSDIVLAAHTLAAIVDVMPQVRNLMVDILDSADSYSMRISDLGDATVAGFEITPVAAPLSGPTSVSDDSAAPTKRKRRQRPADPESFERPDTQDLYLLNRSVLSRWWEAHQKTLQPLQDIPADPGSVRSLFDVAAVTQRPAALNLTHDLHFLLAVNNWYSTIYDERGPSISISDLPIPFILNEKRVYSSLPASRGLGDKSANAMLQSLFPVGVRHYAVPYFALPSPMVGPFDLSGFTGVMPVATLARLSNVVDNPLAQAIATATTLWNKGFVDLNITSVQTALILRSSQLLSQMTANQDEVISQWGGLFKTYRIPTQVQVSGTDANEMAVFRGMAIVLDPAPVVFLNYTDALRVERAQIAGVRFSFTAPTFATHEFPHQVLGSVDALHLLEPTKKEAASEAENLFSNKAPTAYARIQGDEAPKQTEADKMATNPGTKVTTVADGVDSDTPAKSATADDDSAG